MNVIAILETGRPPEDLAARYGDYVDQFRALLGDGVATRRFDVQAGELPDDPAAFAGVIVTGSAAGAYGDLPWSEPPAPWLRDPRGSPPAAGISCGHQPMAQASARPAQ